jgi:DNA-binding transcriptional ArsR family regulator
MNDDGPDAVQDRPPVVLEDARALRAYAHPTRGKLLSLLKFRGPLTATEAGEILGESSGTMSFHLRQLAKYKLVEEAPRGKGKAKPWQATSLFTQLPPFTEDPEIADAAAQLRLRLAHSYFEELTDWLQRRDSESESWQRAEEFGDRVLFATPEELVEIGDRVQEIIEPYARRFGHPQERPDGARQISFIRFAFPSDGLS